MTLSDVEVRALRALVDAGAAGLTGDELARRVWNGSAGHVLFERRGAGLVKATWRFGRLVDAELVTRDGRNGRYRVTFGGELALSSASASPRLVTETFHEVYERLGFSVSDAARLCGVSRATIRAWVATGRAPDGMAERMLTPSGLVELPSWALPGGRRGAR